MREGNPVYPSPDEDEAQNVVIRGDRVQYKLIESQAELAELCQWLSGASRIAFDTEFVSEDTYYPDLCLIQVAAAGKVAVIDPLCVGDVTPFWEVLAGGDHETIAHAGREEFRFCQRATGKRPANLIDVQLAAGLIGLEYPASYGKLIDRLLHKHLPKGETRTDWRRRPLSERQLAYAVQDVEYLEALRNKLASRLEKLGRLPWLTEEMQAWQEYVEDSERGDRWRRTSGTNGLSTRALAIVRELWRWREQTAQRLDRPPRRLLRVDLIVELARRGTSDPKRISALRGMQRRELARDLPAISKAIQQALDLPDTELPGADRRETLPPLKVLGQFLSTALANLCRQEDVAPSLVGTVDDVRDLIAWRLELKGRNDDEPPALERGWRADVVGRKLDGLLTGQVAVLVEDPLAEAPLKLVAEKREEP
jgi:ribonuclease D